MKTVSIFTEKGGEGKTTLSMLFASYLRYHCFKGVVAYDFDTPNYQFASTREVDLYELKRTPALARLASDGGNFYPVEKVAVGAGLDARIIESIRLTHETDRDGYVVMDFPGRFLNSDIIGKVISQGLLDLLVVPVSSDRQSVISATTLATSVTRPTFFAPGSGKTRQETLLVWNKVSSRESSTRRYDSYERMIRDTYGLDFCSTRVRDIVIARRDAGTPGFIRSTICWPDGNVRRFAPYLPALFDEWLERLDAAGGGNR